MHRAGQSPFLALDFADALRHPLIGHVIHRQQQTQLSETRFAFDKGQACLLEIGTAFLAHLIGLERVMGRCNPY